MPEFSKRDDKAPEFLEIVVRGNDGKEWSVVEVPKKEFSTGSVGYYGSEKLKNPENPEMRYQCSFSFTLIGSKPPK
ncbi:MAG: hypothetical protein LBH18_00690 [Spirochaetaceae bacterium]|jgi:hypothetical protein|nr:hypothetical protein [Spirochaetaceae bacterium]